jgi:hypothetical protein
VSQCVPCLLTRAHTFDVYVRQAERRRKTAEDRASTASELLAELRAAYEGRQAEVRNAAGEVYFYCLTQRTHVQSRNCS